MKKTVLSLSLLSILTLAGCANTNNNVINDNCCSNVQKLSIPDLPNINNRLVSYDVRPKEPEVVVIQEPEVVVIQEPEVVVIPSMSINAKVLFAFGL
jgi:PBP1b-binding outer membrane lipoprotein LpoB